MSLNQMSLVKQMGAAFRELEEELRYLKSGTILVQIRNDVIGKFGVRHEPIEVRGEALPQSEVWLTDEHLKAFRELVLGALKHKRGWTYGEIIYEFVLRKNILCISVQFESNYNMASLYNKINPTK